MRDSEGLQIISIEGVVKVSNKIGFSYHIECEEGVMRWSERMHVD